MKNSLYLAASLIAAITIVTLAQGAEEKKEEEMEKCDNLPLHAGQSKCPTATHSCDGEGNEGELGRLYVPKGTCKDIHQIIFGGKVTDPKSLKAFEDIKQKLALPMKKK